MYCPNCKQEFDGKFCPECGTMLIEKPSTSGFSINLGDANAISGGISMSDSHNVHNEDKSVHNISNVSNVTHNVTHVAAQKTEMELLQEKKSLFLNECKRSYEDNVLEQGEVLALEEYRIKIGLDKATADKILDKVRQMTVGNATKTGLNPIAKIKLKQLTDRLLKNEIKVLMNQIEELEPLMNKYDHDELRRKYYLVLSALKSEKCIQRYESTPADNYWESFFTYLAYCKVGKTGEAEEILVSMDRFADYPEDNITLLAVAGALIKGEKAEAEDFLSAVTGDYTSALQRFVDSIYLILKPETAKEMGADEETCAFYLVNFFNQEDPKECARKKAEREAKANAEAEAHENAVQEARAKAEVMAGLFTGLLFEAEAREKAEQEAKATSETEAREKAEQEAKAKVEADTMTPEKVVDNLIDNLFGPFESYNIFSKNDRFKVCKYLVTQREWETVMGDNHSWEKSPGFPVVNITYAEAKEFVDRVNKIALGKGYEFMIPPKEWQWNGYQKECSKELKRASVSAFAWHKDNSEGHLHNVGELQPTAGIYDVFGLVYEMVKTKNYNSYFCGAFNESLENCSTEKSSDLKYPDKRYDDLGLRLVCSKYKVNVCFWDLSRS